MLEPVHFTTPERKNCVFNRALLEWMMVNGHVGQLTPRHIYLRTLWKTISQWKQNFLVFMLPIRCVYGSRWLKIFHDIPNKYRHGASPPWTLKTPCDFYSLHRWCTSSTKEVTQESSAVNAPTRRDSESKVEYLGQVGGRHRAAPIGGWNQWNILFKWKPHSGKLHIIICLNCLGLFTRHQGFVFWMAMTCNS